MEVYNSAWEKNWGFVPVTDEEVAFQAKNLKQVLDQRWAFIAERDGETLGAALTLPDINQVTSEDERPPAALRLAARFLPGTGARSTACGSSPSASSPSTSTRASPPRFYVRHIETAAEVGVQRRRDRLDPGDERADEPRDGGDGREGRQAVPSLREVRSSPRSLGVYPRCLRWVSRMRRRWSSPSPRRRHRRGRRRSGHCRRTGPPGRSALGARGRAAGGRRHGRRRRRRASRSRWPGRRGERRPPRRGLFRRRERVVARRSFLVDVHVLGR